MTDRQRMRRAALRWRFWANPRTAIAKNERFIALQDAIRFRASRAQRMEWARAN